MAIFLVFLDEVTYDKKYDQTWQKMVIVRPENNQS